MFLEDEYAQSLFVNKSTLCCNYLNIIILFNLAMLILPFARLQKNQRWNQDRSFELQCIGNYTAVCVVTELIGSHIYTRIYI